MLLSSENIKNKIDTQLAKVNPLDVQIQVQVS